MSNLKSKTSSGVWQLKNRELVLGKTPLLMGIVNVTPDSFSDGGQFLDPDQAVEHALMLETEGAAILDIGGESTRPGSDPVSEQEELRRVIPVIEQLAGKTSLPISIDTSKSTVASEAISAGAEIVNDVTGLEGDPEMASIVAETNAAVCVMHSQGRPKTMQNNPDYQDVVAEVLLYLKSRRDALIEVGISSKQICLDPGIGFGKTTEHNLQLMGSINEFHSLNCPILVGHSRKRFLGELLGDSTADRTLATVASSLVLAAKGVSILRVHDVKPMAEAIAIFRACGGFEQVN